MKTATTKPARAKAPTQSALLHSSHGVEIGLNMAVDKALAMLHIFRQRLFEENSGRDVQSAVTCGLDLLADHVSDALHAERNSMETLIQAIRDQDSAKTSSQTGPDGMQN